MGRTAPIMVGAAHLGVKSPVELAAFPFIDTSYRPYPTHKPTETFPTDSFDQSPRKIQEKRASLLRPESGQPTHGKQAANRGRAPVGVPSPIGLGFVSHDSGYAKVHPVDVGRAQKENGPKFAENRCVCSGRGRTKADWSALAMGEVAQRAGRFLLMRRPLAAGGPRWPRERWYSGPHGCFSFVPPASSPSITAQ